MESSRKSGTASDGEEECSDLRFDAAHIVKTIAFGVKSVAVSEKLPKTATQIHLNLTTLENVPYCIELSEGGYRVVGNSYDSLSSCSSSSISGDSARNKSFESIDSLLEAISPLYTAAFGQALVHRLHAVQKEQESELCVQKMIFFHFSFLSSENSRWKGNFLSQ